jgi:HSP20 family protein
MIIRHNPWDIVGELNKILENNVKSSLASDDSRVESSRWMPAVDIKEEADQFKLYVDIPGVNPDEIDVSMENNILTIKGERE